MSDLGLDSLDAVEVVMSFEDEFGKHLTLAVDFIMSSLFSQVVKYQMKKQRKFSAAMMQ